MKNLVLNFQLLATSTKNFINYTYKIICKYITLPMYSYNFLITISITYEEHCIKFSSILIGPK
ncbi:hypothetical protein FWK35_00008120 [Aphis craccivora]|uniref:Uncharacterized protein n=1 Tax=Aphis craccivora TaxID=307492 RepID=A0A6G0YQ94_APHCR|nr:hypothetical protein FWK35_00008120 [Aphis craccivora]